MNTEYYFSIDRVEGLLEAIDAEDSTIMKQLGHVELESDDFNALYFKDKDSQKAKNEGIEKTIEELRKFRTR